jgi:hypothetical protein
MKTLAVIQVQNDYTRRGRAMLEMPDALPAPRVSDANEKMQKTARVLAKHTGKRAKVVAFNLPAAIDFRMNGAEFNTCPQAGACKGVCYARQNTFIYPGPIQMRVDNLWSTFRATFADEMADEIGKATHVRIHDSGDFYSQEYLDSWIAIARKRPDVVFYAYTKSLHLDWQAAPENLRIVQSEGGKLDAMIDYSRPHSRIVVDVPAGYTNGNAELADTPAIDGTVRIALPYHGGRKLTDSQARYFGGIHAG